MILDIGQVSKLPLQSVVVSGSGTFIWVSQASQEAVRCLPGSNDMDQSLQSCVITAQSYPGSTEPRPEGVSRNMQGISRCPWLSCFVFCHSYGSMQVSSRSYDPYR